jgi:hypothetical protein
VRAWILLAALAACAGSPTGDDGAGGNGGGHAGSGGSGGSGGSAAGGSGPGGGGGDPGPRDCTPHVVIGHGVPVDDAAVASLGGDGHLLVVRQAGPFTVLRTDRAGDPVGQPLALGAGASPQLARAGPHAFVATVRDGRSLLAAYLVDDEATRATPISFGDVAAPALGGVQPAGDDGALLTLARTGALDYTWVDAQGALRGSWHHQAMPGSVYAAVFPRHGGVGVLTQDGEGALALLRLEGPDADTSGVPVFDRPVKRFRLVQMDDGGAAVAALLDAAGEPQLGVARIDPAGRLEAAVNLGPVEKSAGLPLLSGAGTHLVVTSRPEGRPWSFWDLPIPLAPADPVEVPVTTQQVLHLERDPPGVRVLAGRQAEPVLTFVRSCPG